MSYRTETATRVAEPDLGLTPRDESRLGHDFPDALRAICSGNDLPKGIWSEVSELARKRAGIGPGAPTSITVPTGAAIWTPSRIDHAARIRAMQRAAAPMVTSTDSIGGFLRGVENISFIEMLRNRMVAFAMGARRMSGLVGNVTVPKQTAGATAYWLSTETTAITESQQTLGQLALTPRTVGAYSEISRLLQLQSSPDAQSLIVQDLAAQVAIAADAAVIAGTGTEQPTGILGTANVGAFTGTSLDGAGLLNAQTDVAAANALTPTCGYVFTPATAALLMARPELPTTGTTRLWQGNIAEGEIFGFRAMSSAQMPTAKGIFGDWAQVVVGEWGVLELAVNPAANFPAGITGLRAMYTMDVGVRTPAAFSVATSIS